MSTVTREPNMANAPGFAEPALNRPSATIRARPLRLAVSRVVPRWMKTWVRRALNTGSLCANTVYDLRRFWRWSSVARRSGARLNLRALIAMNTHNVEKGLSLKEPRPGFGLDRIRTLMSDLGEYTALYGFDDMCEVTINVLRQYQQFNLKHGIDNMEVARFLAEMSHQGRCQPHGGTLTTTQQEIHSAAKMDMRPFFSSRFSVRQFDTSRDVEMRLIEEAVAMAQKTPSVCNRQSCRVWALQERADVIGALEIQRGAVGFAEQVNKVLVVTSELAHFVNVGERYQGWIDGGMFSMSLVYALHSLGLGTCCLNWSKRREVDKEMKRFLGIGDSETIIMLIAVGHLPETVNVAQSVRKKLDDVLVTVNARDRRRNPSP